MDNYKQLTLINKLNQSIKNNDSISIQNKIEKQLLIITKKLQNTK
jgi:hypothetical protein